MRFVSLRVYLKSCLQSITGPVARIVYYGMASVAVHPRASSIPFPWDRKLWMEGPLLPKKPCPDLLHTPGETKESPGLITHLPHDPAHQRCGLPDGLVKSPTLRTTHREAVTQLEFLDLKHARAEGTPSQ